MFKEHKEVIIELNRTPPYIHETWRDTRDNGLHGQFIPVKIMERYRKELTFQQHYWGSLNKGIWTKASAENTDDEKPIDIGCGILTPMIDKREAQQLLEKATTQVAFYPFFNLFALGIPHHKKPA